MKRKTTFNEARIEASHIADLANRRNYNWFPLAQMTVYDEPTHIAEVLRGIYLHCGDLSFSASVNATEMPRPALYLLRELCEAFEAMSSHEADFTTTIKIEVSAKPIVIQTNSIPDNPQTAQDVSVL